MKKASAVATSFILLLSVLLSPNCATLIRNRTQRIPVTSSPMGATVIVNGVQQGVTPLEIKLTRKKNSQVIRIESPGFNPAEIRLTRKLGTYLFPDILLGFFLGSAAFTLGPGGSDDMEERFVRRWPLVLLSAAALPFLDIAISKKYTLEPDYITVTLTKVDGLPRVDTILVDAEAFRNVKWIRVHRD
ncbi:MAG: PEGA domain-containing protein [Candidatus Aminicenantes bacterium]|nr:PEGA domain-containing protein [Candidatus Aminicenantes bacterium]